jgi:hypothetical protein
MTSFPAGTVHFEVPPEPTVEPEPPATTTLSAVRLIVKLRRPLCPSGSRKVPDSVGVVLSLLVPLAGARLVGAAGARFAGVTVFELRTNAP